jgi:hypothetical protein
VPGGQWPLVAVVAVVATVRYLVAAAVIGLLTAVLPGLSSGRPAVVTVLVTSLLYRLLHTGTVSLLDSLLGLGTFVAAPVLRRAT